MINSHKSIIFILCAIFSMIFMLFPWEALVGEFWDRAVYVEMFTTGDVVTEYEVFDSVLKFFTHEWLWNYSVYWWVSNGGSVELIFFLIGFVFVFLCSFLLVTRCGFFYLLFLFNPLFVDLAVSQVRTAAAFSLLIIAYRFRRSVFCFVLCVAAAMIHTASLVFIFFYFFVSSERLLGRLLSWWGILFFSLVFSFFLGPGRELVLSLVQDRRAVYEGMSSSFLFMSFWWWLLIVLCVYYKKISDDVLSRYGYLLVAVSCFNGLFLSYSTRFLAVSIPFLACAIKRLPMRVRLFSICVGSVYFVFQWVYRVS